MQVAGSAAAYPAPLISDENFSVPVLFNLLNSNNKNPRNVTLHDLRQSHKIKNPFCYSHLKKIAAVLKV